MEHGSLSVASLLCPSSHNDRKRSHQQMSHSNPSLTCTAQRSSSRSDDTASSSSTVLANLRIPSFTLSGRGRAGYDMRRPMSITTPQPEPQEPRHDIIDLTQDRDSAPSGFVLPPERTPDPLLRRPRGNEGPEDRRPAPDDPSDQGHHAVLIDLSDEDPQPVQRHSPDIQFLSSRARSRSVSIDDRPAARPVTNRPPAPNYPAPLAHWVPERGPIPPGLGVRVGRLREQIGQGLGRLVGWEAPLGAFPVPNELDFQTIGFDLGPPNREPPQPRSPTYEAPSEPRPGFTRSPEEDEFLVCPNCDDELGVGPDEVKKQVWAVKQCGHVYCGQCMKNRASSKRKQAPKSGTLSKAFGKCVVPGCGKAVAHPKTVIQIYL